MLLRKRATQPTVLDNMSDSKENSSTVEPTKSKLKEKVHSVLLPPNERLRKTSPHKEANDNISKASIRNINDIIVVDSQNQLFLMKYMRLISQTDYS